jgi:hypothetical protein
MDDDGRYRDKCAWVYPVQGAGLRQAPIDPRYSEWEEEALQIVGSNARSTAGYFGADSVDSLIRPREIWRSRQRRRMEPSPCFERILFMKRGGTG